MNDRPWGRTLGALCLRKLTGQLTLAADDGKEYRIAFEDGAVIGATSPLVIDSAVRVALTNRLISATHVAQIARVIAAQPEQDELDALVKACALEPEHALRLRQRVILQRAARTFSVESGSFVIDDVVTIAVSTAAAVDTRAIVYLGARTNLSEERLIADLRSLGQVYTLKADATSELRHFGLTTTELPIVDVLRGGGTTLPELEAKHRDLDPRTAQSVIYALVSCFACEATSPSAAPVSAPADVEVDIDIDVEAFKPPPTPLATPRTVTPRSMPRVATRERAGRPPSNFDDVTIAPPRTLTARTKTPIDRPILQAASRTTTAPTVVSPRPLEPRTLTRRPALPRAPSSLPAVAHVETFVAQHGRDPLAEAADAFVRGQSALRDDQIPTAIEALTKAIELNPQEFDYHATLAWAQFCASPDRAKLSDKVRKMLTRAIQKSMQPELPRFFLARMERLLGHDREALLHFQQVLAAEPHNLDAASEVRSIETRLAAGSAEKPGIGSLFGRKKP